GQGLLKRFIERRLVQGGQRRCCQRRSFGYATLDISSGLNFVQQEAQRLLWQGLPIPEAKGKTVPRCITAITFCEAKKRSTRY
ncbi:hypothetical protein NL292_25865, partial [Klebsiella pneumoniae]|nr:hypothetical protein [Klebsiella pneumoniae]